MKSGKYFKKRKYRKNNSRKVQEKPFATVSGKAVQIDYWGSRENPKISFKRIIRDEFGTPIRHENRFSHDDLYILREALEYAQGLHHPRTSAGVSPLEKPNLEALPENSNNDNTHSDELRQVHRPAL